MGADFRRFGLLGAPGPGADGLANVFFGCLGLGGLFFQALDPFLDLALGFFLGLIHELELEAKPFFRLAGAGSRSKEALRCSICRGQADCPASRTSARRPETRSWKSTQQSDRRSDSADARFQASHLLAQRQPKLEQGRCLRQSSMMKSEGERERAHLIPECPNKPALGRGWRRCVCRWLVFHIRAGVLGLASAALLHRSAPFAALAEPSGESPCLVSSSDCSRDCW